MPTITIHNEELHRIDPRLFGQFLERATFGEGGPEPASDDQGILRKECQELLEAFAPAVVRFPGGTDIDYIDWTDMISAAPSHSGKTLDRAGRPLTTGHNNKSLSNAFGYDEYFALRDTLQCESIIVLNLLDGYSKKVPLEEAALHVAGLVAYCNAEVDTPLPAGMPNWPAIRARNGHEKAFKADYIQLGNEWWCGRFKETILALFTTGEGEQKQIDHQALAAWTIECLHAYIKAIRAVDAKVPLIMDGKMPGDIEDIVLADPFIKQHIRYVTYHYYAPMGPASKISQNGNVIDKDDLDPEEYFFLLSSILGDYNGDGQNHAFHKRCAQAIQHGYRVVFTEWNWNGWGFADLNQPTGVDWHQPVSLGVAAFIHGMMRQGAYADMANQSTFLGHGWSIAAIFYDKDIPGSAHYGAQGRTTKFLKEHHGSSFLKVEHQHIPVHKSAYEITWFKNPEAAYVDVVASANTDRLFINLVHRSFSEAMDIAINLQGFNADLNNANMHLLRMNERIHEGPEKWLHESREAIDLSAGSVSLPARSVICIEVPLRQ